MARTTVEKDNGSRRGRRAEEVQVELPPSPSVFETGQAAFKRIASKRVNNILDKLNTLAKLTSGKGKYGYTDEDVEYVRKTLIKAVNSACDRMRRQPVPKGGFSFERKSEDAGA